MKVRYFVSVVLLLAAAAFADVCPKGEHPVEAAGGSVVVDGKHCRCVKDPKRPVAIIDRNQNLNANLNANKNSNRNSDSVDL